MTSTQHYLALRPCLELLSVGDQIGGEGQAFFIPRGAVTSTLFPTSTMEILRLGEHLELQRSQSRSTSFFLLLTSGGIVIYLLYKSCTSTHEAVGSKQPHHQKRSNWSSGHSWLRWLFFGDSRGDLGHFFGPLNSMATKLPKRSKDTEYKASHVSRLQQPQSNIIYVSPCPNCVRGVCKIRKHHQMLLQTHPHRQWVTVVERGSASTSGSSSPIKYRDQPFLWPPMRTAESADDESSEDDGSVVINLPDKKRKFSRIPPEGRERSRTASIIKREDESMESIAGVSGSMVDLVKGAREVRRLIREASFDSLASEFSLDVSIHEGVGDHTANQFDSICQEIHRLKDSCDAMSESIDFKQPTTTTHSQMKHSKSEYFPKEPSPGLSVDMSLDGSSSPDLRNLHKLIHSAPRSKALWTLTHNTGFSDNDSNYSPIHRDTSASPLLYRSSASRYKLALSSNTSDCGEWEWDSEGLDSYAAHNADLSSVQDHENWLQDEVMELDLEAELLSSTMSKRRGSGYSSTGSDFLDSSSLYNKVRLPPSGRSSVMSQDLGGHQDLKSLMTLNISRSSSASSLKGLDSPYYFYHPRRSKRSPSSDESGIEDKSAEFSSMMSSLTTPLSPVHEARETNSPKHKSSKEIGEMSENDKTPCRGGGNKARRRLGHDIC